MQIVESEPRPSRGSWRPTKKYYRGLYLAAQVEGRKCSDLGKDGHLEDEAIQQRRHENLGYVLG